VINIGVMSVDLSNDPVMKSLLEVQKEDCKLCLQWLYLSKQC